MHGIFAITIELPKGAAQRYYPSQSEINKFNSQNLNAVLWYLQQADCPYAAAGLGGKHCGSSSESAVLLAVGLRRRTPSHPQQTNCWCAVASTRAMLESIDASISVAQTDVNDYMTGTTRTTGPIPAFSGYVQCSRGSPKPQSTPMTHAAWPGRCGTGRHLIRARLYNDYEGTSQSTMNWRIVRGIRATGDPVGVIVVHGEHAILAVGYQTDARPAERRRPDKQDPGHARLGPVVQRRLRQLVGLARGRFRAQLVRRDERLEQQVLHGRSQRRSVFPGPIRDRGRARRSPRRRTTRPARLRRR